MRSLIAGAVAAIVATAAADLRAQRAPATLTLTRDLRIDAADADLSPISWLAVARDGSIALGQEQDHLVRFFDARGSSLGTFGRQGEGPGEFRMMRIHGWVDDTLWVTDGSTRRVTLISPRRTLVRTIPWPVFRSDSMGARPVPKTGFAVPWAVYSDGALLVWALIARDNTAPLPTFGDGQRPGGALIRFRASGAAERVMALLPPLYPQGCSVSFKTGTDGTGAAGNPFCTRLLSHIASDGSRVAFALATFHGNNAGSYQIIVIDARGDTALSRSYSFTPIAIPKRTADSVLGRYVAASPTPEHAAAFRAMRAPPYYPPLREILTGRDGTIWLELRTQASSNHWRVLDAAGTVIGDVTVPRNVMIKVAERQNVWATETGDDGLESIVRYRVAPRGGYN